MSRNDVAIGSPNTDSLNDGRAEWERPVLRRLAATAAEGHSLLNREGEGQRRIHS